MHNRGRSVVLQKYLIFISKIVTEGMVKSQVKIAKLVWMSISQRIHFSKDTNTEVIFVFVSILLPVPSAWSENLGKFPAYVFDWSNVALKKKKAYLLNCCVDIKNF